MYTLRCEGHRETIETGDYTIENEPLQDSQRIGIDRISVELFCKRQKDTDITSSSKAGKGIEIGTQKKKVR